MSFSLSLSVFPGNVDCVWCREIGSIDQGRTSERIIATWTVHPSFRCVGYYCVGDSHELQAYGFLVLFCTSNHHRVLFKWCIRTSYQESLEQIFPRRRCSRGATKIETVFGVLNSRTVTCFSANCCIIRTINIITINKSYTCPWRFLRFSNLDCNPTRQLPKALDCWFRPPIQSFRWFLELQL